MKIINHIKVRYKGKLVGRLAITKNHLVAFQYDENWFADGFSISPLTLPLESKVFLPKYLPFDGLFGVFDDSLPDGWGRLLVDRLLRSKNINPAEVNPVTRLAIVGQSGMGALDYHTLMQLTHFLTNNFAEVEKMYKLMCFNVFTHNRDDHSRNFSYIYDDEKKSGNYLPHMT